MYMNSIRPGPTTDSPYWYRKYKYYCSGLLLCFSSASCFYPADYEVNSNKCTDPNGLQWEIKLESILLYKHIGYDMIDSQQGAQCRVGCNHLISNKNKHNYCFTSKSRDQKSALQSSQTSRFPFQTSNFSVLHVHHMYSPNRWRPRQVDCQLDFKKGGKTCPG